MKKSIKSDYIWNTLAGLLNAAEAVLMSMIVTRITGLSDAGVLTLAFAVGNLMMTIGKFGVRNFQVTDVAQKYKFKEYVCLRFATVIVMIVVSFVYSLYGKCVLDYSIQKIMTIFCICFIYAIESLEDVFWGEYQLKEYLYVGAKMFCIRWGSILTIFLFSIIIMKNMIRALVISAALSFIIFIIGLFITYKKIFGQKLYASTDRVCVKNMCHLAYAVLPLFLVNFLTFYVNNAPKYAIDRQLTDEIQACYGFVAMPIFVIGLLNSFIYQPSLVKMSIEWKDKKMVEMKKRVNKQIVFLIAMLVIILIGAYWIGIPVLSWLYATDLQQYKIELLILLVGGGFLALSGYFSILLTIMRYSKDLLIGYSIVAMISGLSLNKLVRDFGTMGAAIGYTIIMLILSIVFGCDYLIRMKMKNCTNS